MNKIEKEKFKKKALAALSGHCYWGFDKLTKNNGYIYGFSKKDMELDWTLFDKAVIRKVRSDDEFYIPVTNKKTKEVIAVALFRYDNHTISVIEHTDMEIPLDRDTFYKINEIYEGKTYVKGDTSL